MEPLMNLQSACSGVLLVAVYVVADKGFFTSMSQFVGLQMALCNELLLALFAHEWSLPCVGPHVSL